MWDVISNIDEGIQITSVWKQSDKGNILTYKYDVSGQFQTLWHGEIRDIWRIFGKVKQKILYRMGHVNRMWNITDTI